MISNLPFVISPKQEKFSLGNDRTGVLEFPRHWGLLVREKIEIDEAMELSPFVLAAELAVQIQQEQGIQDLTLCLDIVLGTQRESDADKLLMQQLRIRYSSAIAKIEKYASNDGSREQFATVTAIIKRIAPDWNSGDTFQLNDELYQKIWDFAKSELAIAKASQSEEVSEEDIKKLLAPVTKLEPTGSESTGSSSPTGAAMTDSMPSILETSHVG